MIEIDSQLKQLEGEAPAILMNEDFRSSADNLGGRLYKTSNSYMVPPGAMAEMEAQEPVIGKLIYLFHRQCARPVYDMVSVKPSVTRWFTSDGLDTYHLKAGEVTVVPANLAEFLLFSGFAQKGGV